MSKTTNWISLILFVILVVLIAVYGALRLPYIQAKNEMPQGTVPELSSALDRQAGSNSIFSNSSAYMRPGSTTDRYCSGMMALEAMLVTSLACGA